MSCDGVTIGLPSFGAKIFLDANINSLASACASSESGRWTAIWSPSKSALNGGHTSGCNLIAFPSTSFGSNAWIPSLCRVGARFSKTGCSTTTFSHISIASGWPSSIISRAFFTEILLWPFSDCSLYFSINAWMMKGLNRINAISRGIPHWYIFRSGPTAITERPEKSTRLPSKFWRKRPCLPRNKSDNDLSGLFFSITTFLLRLPLSIKASTASCSIRFSFFVINDGARCSNCFFKRLFLFKIRRYKSFKSVVANLPPSSWTIGRRSGGITGITSITIHSGLLSLFKKASATSKRLIIFSFLCLVAVFNSNLNSATTSSKCSSSSRSNCLIASAPVNDLKLPRPNLLSKSLFSCSVKILPLVNPSILPGSITMYDVK